MRTGILPALACLLTLVVGGCGGNDAREPVAQDPGSQASEPSQTPVPEGPQCQRVWVDGHALAQGYKGCVEDGAWVAAEKKMCDSGQVIVVFADRYYGARGAIVNDVGAPLDKSKQYHRAIRSCG